MRTTLNIDDDLLKAAKSIAGARSVSIGAVISDLVRKGLEASIRRRSKSGFPVFPVAPGSAPISLEDVKKLEDEE